jgi:uncharacterized protein (DUF2062 family)
MTKHDVAATAAGTISATFLGLGMDMIMALVVGGLTICLLLIRIGLSIREWRKH